MMGAFDAAQSFLKETRLSAFIDEQHVDLATLSEYSTIEAAMELFASKHIMSAPVLDEDGEYYGCVSVGDVLKGVTKEFVELFGPHYAENISNITPEQLKECGRDFTGKAVRAIMHEGDLWLKGDPSTSLMDVVELGFNIKEKRVHHRIFVCDPAKAHHVTSAGKTTVVNIEPGSERVQASGWRPTDVVSQLDVINVLWAHRDVLGSALDISLEDAGAFLGAEETVAGDLPALVAFHHMFSDHKSTLGITSSRGKLVGALSVSDLRYLPADGFALLLRPVAEYVAIVHGNGLSVHEAIAGAHVEGTEGGKWEDVLKNNLLLTLSPGSTVGQLLEMVVTNKAHRVHVVDEAGAPLSIITLTDILRLITKTKPVYAVHLPVETEEDDDIDDDVDSQDA